MTSSYNNLPSFVQFGARIFSQIWTLKYRLFYGGRVKFGKNFITNWRFKVSGPGKITFGDNIQAWAQKEKNQFLTYSPDATITIKDNCRINGAGIQAAKSVTIGKNCILGSTTIADTDFHSTRIDRSTETDAPVISKAIEIGDNVWVAGQSAILKGVHIGKGSVIGFRAVVRGDVPPNAIVIGNPGKTVGQVPTS